MARRSKRPQKTAAPRAPRPVVMAPAPAAPPQARVVERAPARPRFWFGFEIPWAKLVLVRVALFGVLAVDAFLALRHAPRYGSGFNVGNLRILDDLAPGRAAFTVLELGLAYLFALFALGVATRLLPLAAAIYGWIYFSSQLDSYQHHYLVFLVLVLASFVPWRHLPRPGGEPAAPMRAWALRLILVQLGLLYAWAVIAKLHPAWLDGSALSQQISTAWMRRQIEHLPGAWRTAAYLTIALELLLAVGVWNRRLWPIVAPLGIVFHVMIELSGLQIGLFSFVMVALYMLAVPDRVVEAAGAALGSLTGGARTRLRAFGAKVGAWPWLAPALIAATAAIAIGVAKVHVAPAVSVVVVGGGAVIGTLVARARRGALAAAHTLAAHVVVAALLLGLDATTSVANDYYRFWGGSARRLGHVDEARTAYGRLLEIDPSSVTAHYWLGNLDAGAGHGDDALAHWRAAEQLDATDTRAALAEARYLVTQGRRDDALIAAKKALAAEPGNRDARALVDSLATPTKAAP